MAKVTPAYPALAVAAPVRPFFGTPGATGRILAAFDRSCYLETAKGQLIAVLAESLGRGPFALTVGGSPSLKVSGGPSFTALRAEETVSIADGTLHLGPMRVDLRSALPWDPTLPPLDGPAESGVGVLTDLLRAHAPAEGLARLPFDEVATSSLLDTGRRALERLRAGLVRADATAITEGAAHLAGLGPGLTPSGDDVLAGILLALRARPEAAGRLGPAVVSTLLVGTAAPRTGRISRAYLWAARQGHAAEAWHDLFRALPADAAGVRTSAARILQTGETSGADMLAGFVFLSLA